MNITIWNEFVHEEIHTTVSDIYPDGIHGAIAAGLKERLDEAQITTATLKQPEHGLGEAVIGNTDVLFWWGHLAHDQVDNGVVARVHDAVLQGMGLVVLHSAHLSKIFTRLMGTTCNLRWRESDDRELVWCTSPTHPIARDVEWPIELPEHEMYGEFFDIPQPDELVCISSFSGGEVFRSGCCFTRGKGRVFYFSPGHETYPIYHDPKILKVLANAALWAQSHKSSPIVTNQSPNAPKDWWR